MVFRSLGTGILAAAFAAASLTAAPARADHDTAKIIAGVAALTLLGIAISESNRNHNSYVVTRGHVHGYGYGHGHHFRYARQPCLLPRHRGWQRHYHNSNRVYFYN